ncbi:MAG: circadian clock protein KaiC [Solirubrobacteraceae bacterium]|jgi:circadian clock protein KaiC|nr:circadian clock protein KaiC [Solirubrobacteraceae bacterium]MEA2184713.1 circadian clock protein KaiC [Solirubrobacteraceae bacterium]
MAATVTGADEMTTTRGAAARMEELPKTPTGISGLDEVTGGGLPQGRPTLVCGPAGCGKTLLAMEFLVRGITQFNEPGVFMAFEESADDLIANVASLGFDLAQSKDDGMLVIDHVKVPGGEMQETGDWDLDGLFLRLGTAVDTIGAKRVVIDTIENLFGAFSNRAVLRSELRRLFGWLKERGVTAVITGERGDGTLTRFGIEEYVSDCVIVLDHRVTEQTSTRRLRILKYRGSLHGTNEYPFLIGESGMSVLPITSPGLRNSASTQRLSTGVARLDAMLGDGGFYKGSTVLVNGTAGTGKSTLAAQFCDATCRRGERALYFAFGESEAEIVRNMSSVGIDLWQWVNAGLLQFRCFRPSVLGLEAHLFAMQKFVDEFDPAAVVMDPVSDLLRIGTGADVSAMLTRQVDFLKAKGVTALFTSLTSDAEPALADQQIASLVDTWILLKTMEGNGEHNRVLYVLKSRGMAHSNQIREFLLTDQGIELADVYVGPQGVLTGSARQAQEAQERSDGTARLEDLEQRRVNLERRRESVEAHTAALWREFEDEADIVGRLLSHGSTGVEDRAGQRAEQGRLRRADTDEYIAHIGELDVGAL